MNVNAKVAEINHKLNLASWYTAMSDKQEKLCHNFHNILRDDFEQGTGHNVYNALYVLGIKPVISKKKLARIVLLSRNNILAFLFFVLEGYYKTCRKNGQFSVNEKLLMIAISKIDFLPTVRGLNRILPPAQTSDTASKNILEKQNQIQEEAEKNAKCNFQGPMPQKQEKAKRKSTKTPYFTPQPRPVPRPLNLGTTTADFVVGFKFWPPNQSPNYGPEEEAPWFADYHLNPGQRLIKQTLSETLGRFFKVSQGPTNTGSEDDAKAEDSTLCLVHKTQVVEAQILKDELTVKARDRCLELVDVQEPYATIRRKKILAQLEHDIDIIMERHRKAMYSDQTKVLTIDNFDCVVCQHMLVSQPWPEPGRKAGRALVGDDTEMAHTAVTRIYHGRRLEGGGLGKGKGKGKPKAKAKEVPPPPPPPKPEPKKVPKWRPPPRKMTSSTFRMTKIDFKTKTERCRLPAGPSVCSIPPAPKKTPLAFALAPGKIMAKNQQCDMRFQKKRIKKKFFRAARNNKPYIFKYHRVFQSGQPKGTDLNKFMCASFVKALDKSTSDEEGECGLSCQIAQLNNEESSPDIEQGSETGEHQMNQGNQRNQENEISESSDSGSTIDRSSDHSQQSHVDYKAEIMSAVVRCAETVFRKREMLKRAEMQRKGRHTPYAGMTEETIQRYDPDNDEQMDKLLKDGMRTLCKDHRYVLASLPDAHKIPALREWVKRRYGKVYTAKDLERSISDAKVIFDMVSKVQDNPPPPKMLGLDRLKSETENFGHYKEIKKTAGKARQEYYDMLNTSYMAALNPAWHAMGNYLMPGGPPRMTFFAYMASNPQQIMRNKTWAGQFRDQKAFRFQRLNAERMQRKF